LNLQKTAEDRDRIIQDRDRIRTEMERFPARRAIQYAKRLRDKRKGV
jgi:hypothetical protein